MRHHALYSIIATSLCHSLGWGQTGLIPINDLGTAYYQGEQGGLYPGGVNLPPATHLAAAIGMASQILPRDAAGNPHPNGRIIMLTVGMSNTNQESAPFERQEDANSHRNARLIIINGAVGGQTASTIRNPNAAYWTTVQRRLDSMAVSAQQVQVIWLKEANANPPNNWPLHAHQLRDDLRAVVQVLRDKFPNAFICYCSSRTYGGYATTTLNPEPQAYQSGFSYKWLITEQIDGSQALNYDPNAGPVEAPLLLWGPYLWADGTIPRSDGLTWLRTDFEADGTHPAPSGEQKVADLLSNFFQNDLTARPWFAAQAGSYLKAVNTVADAHVYWQTPDANFGSAVELRVQGGSAPYRTYLKFDLSSVARPVSIAKLSLRVRGGSSDTRLYLVPDTSWSESSITWNNAPPLGKEIVVIPAASREGSVSADITSEVNADSDGVLTFVLTSAATSLSTFTSKEGGEPPRIVLTIDTEQIHPYYFEVARGSLISGGISSLLNSDDDYLVVRESPTLKQTDPSAQLVVHATLVNTLITALRFRVESSVSAIPAAAVAQTVELFNFLEQRWEVIHQGPASWTDSIAEVYISENLQRFFAPGSGRLEARISWYDTGSLFFPGFTVRVDETVWEVSR